MHIRKTMLYTELHIRYVAITMVFQCAHVLHSEVVSLYGSPEELDIEDVRVVCHGSISPAWLSYALL